MWMLLWVMLLDKISVNITFPILTFVFFSTNSHLFVENTSYAMRSYWYGICLSIPHLLGIFSIPLLSIVSDSIGRKSILMITAVAAFVFALSCSFGILLGSLALVLLGKFVGGFLSRTDAVAQAAVADYSTTENKLNNMARLQVVISMGAALGPMLGGYFAEGPWFGVLNYALPYLIATLFAIATVIFIILCLKEDAVKKVTVKTNFNDLFQLLSYKPVLKISFLLLLVQISWGSYYQFIPPVLKTTFHFSAMQVGLFVGLVALWLALASAFAVPILKRHFQSNQIINYCCYGLLVGMLSTLLASMLVTNAEIAKSLLWVGAVLISASDVVIYAIISTLYSNAVGEAQQGTVMGICFIIYSIVWALVALLGGFIAGYAVILPIWVGMIGIILAILWQHYKPLEVIA
ncbi:MAG: hypothetical protein A3F17_06065 [Gammaproteobacteria bacterium RIFCSPHIGHO2_12_FULL_41_15]|nr:MAG: hypothetical protein A3F17_06065 [Gammaproteobacteria bacterium RIFCSPHIGHO2_12_FULL_41_15]